MTNSPPHAIAHFSIQLNSGTQHFIIKFPAHKPSLATKYVASLASRHLIAWPHVAHVNAKIRQAYESKS